MHIFFYLGVILIAGLIMGNMVSLIKLPKVTGYLIGGLIIGPSLLGIIPNDISGSLNHVAEAALGFIAYSIGSEFNFSSLKKVGKSAFIITLYQVFITLTIITLGMIYIFKQSLSFSLVLGAIGTATAPAATLMVIKQYRAKGPLVDTLLPIVAIDDALGVIVFGISIAIAKTTLITGPNLSLLEMIIHPFIEIILAITIGCGLGLILTVILHTAKGQKQVLTTIVACLLVSIGIASSFNISSLLMCMAIGATVTNTLPNSTRVVHITDKFTPPILVGFFTAAGAELNVRVLFHMGLIGLGYILLRFMGKIIGAYIGSVRVHAPKKVKNYIGFTLIPQAGVAIGLAMVAQNTLPNGGELRTIILAATVIYELIGPLLTKFALFKAGEAYHDKTSTALKSM